MKTVLLDTNFLLIPYNERIDIFEEIARLVPYKYGIAILSTAKAELEKISGEGRGGDRIAAQVGLELIGAKGVRVMEVQKDAPLRVDDQIVAAAGNDADNVIVCTNDSALRKKVKAAGALVISMRGRTHLDYV